MPYSWKNIQPAGKRWPESGIVGFPPSSSIGWKIKPACLRWVCRCINSQGQVTGSQLYGGSTVNNISLNDLTQRILNKFGNETSAGLYIYTIEFFGWYRKSGGWIGRDDIYTIYKRKL